MSSSTALGWRTDSSTQPANASLRVWLGFLAMVLGMFMAVLDIQIVASSLGDLQGGLAATVDEISWVQTSYLIGEIVMIPLSGFLTRLMSTKRLFMLSCAGFTVASVLCAFAWNLESMIAFRAVQGFLGGAMIPTVFAVPYLLFPKHQQQQSLIAIGLTATMAPTLGPVIGGWITESFGWPWIFLVNVPFAMLVMVAVGRLIDMDKPDWSLLRKFDVAGLVLLALTLGSLQYALEEGPRWDWFDDRAIGLAVLVAVLSGLLFVGRALVSTEPIVDLRAFRDRNFTTGCLASFIFGIGIYAPVYVLPLFLGQVRGYDALQIGTIMVVLGGFQFLSAPLAANISKMLDLRAMLGIGLALYGVGLLMNAQMTSEASFWELFGPQAVRGLALMLCFIPINTLALGTLPPERLANASGLYNLMRNLGGAMGIAAVDTLFDNRFYHHVSRLSESLSLGRPELAFVLESLDEGIGAMQGSGETVTAHLVMTLVRREALVLGYNDIFLVLGLLFITAISLMPLVQKPQHEGVPVH